MRPMYNPALQYEPLTTTENPVMISGMAAPNTNQVRQFELFSSNRLAPRNPQEGFTHREMVEITRSLIDLRLGNYKTFRTSEELFADLDQ